MLFVFLFLAAITELSAQTTVSGSFVHDSILRTYSFYVPASYIPGQPVPLILNLHGTGTDGAYQAQHRDFRPIADTANFIVVHPDGTIEPNLNQRFWNYGNVLSSTVDDVGFLEVLIDTISAHYSIDQSRVYSVGMSNGGFMTYYLACQTNRFAAIGSVTGSMSTGMYNTCNPARPTPSIHIHGTSDPINTYTGTSTSMGIEQVSLFWANENGCDTIPIIIPVADIDTTDNATAERYIYANGINGNTVEHFKVTGGGHTWPGQYVFTFLGNTCMDFSASIEIWRFFNRYRLTSVAEHEAVETGIGPNPVSGKLNIHAEGHTVTGIIILDMQGRVVEEQTNENITSIDLSHLKAGFYIVKISGEGFYATKKLVVSPQ